MLLIVCCRNTNKTPEDISPKIESALRKYVSSKIKDGSIIDSIKVLRIDTITPKSREALNLNRLLSDAERLGSKMDLDGERYKLTAQKAALNRSLFGKNDALTKIAEDDVVKARLDVQESIDKGRAISLQIDSIKTLLLSGTLDSTTFLGYHPTFYIQALNHGSASVKGDTLQGVILDRNFHVIER